MNVDEANAILCKAWDRFGKEVLEGGARAAEIWDQFVREVLRGIESIEMLRDLVYEILPAADSLPPNEYARKKNHKHRPIVNIRSTHHANLKPQRHLPYQRRNF